MKFEVQHRRGLARRLLGRHNTDATVVTQRNRGLYNASALDAYGPHGLIRPIGVPALAIFVCSSGLSVNTIAAQMRVGSRIAEVGAY